MDLLCCHGSRLLPAGARAGARLSLTSTGGGRGAPEASEEETNLDVAIRVVKAELHQSEGFLGMADLFATVHWETADGCQWQVARTPTIWMSGLSPEFAHECPRQSYVHTRHADAESGSGKRPRSDTEEEPDCIVLVEVWQERYGGLGEPSSSGGAAASVRELLSGALDSPRHWAQGPEVELELRRGEELCGTVTLCASVRRLSAAGKMRSVVAALSESSTPTKCSRDRSVEGASGQRKSSCSVSDYDTDEDSPSDRRLADAMMQHWSRVGEGDGQKQMDSRFLELAALATKLRAAVTKCPKGGQGLFSFGAKQDRFVAIHGGAGDRLDVGDVAAACARGASRAHPRGGFALSWWSSEASWRDREPPLDGILVSSILGVVADKQGGSEASSATVVVTFVEGKEQSDELELTFAEAPAAQEWVADLRAFMQQAQRLQAS